MIDKVSVLEQLYDQIIIPIYVYKEFERAPNKKLIKKIDSLIKRQFIEVKDIETKEEYLNFTNFKKGNITGRRIGNGEASAITLAVMNKGILASNNTRDVIQLVEIFKIDWIKTGDILLDALQKNIINSYEAEKMWAEMLKEKRHLGNYKTFKEFVEENDY